jgi:hypothetical protein
MNQYVRTPYSLSPECHYYDAKSFGRDQYTTKNYWTVIIIITCVSISSLIGRMQNKVVSEPLKLHSGAPQRFRSCIKKYNDILQIVQSFSAGNKIKVKLCTNCETFGTTGVICMTSLVHLQSGTIYHWIHVFDVYIEFYSWRNYVTAIYPDSSNPTNWPSSMN